MGIDIHTERILSLSDATKALPSLGGKRIHPSTLWRWCTQGLRGIRLEYARLGHRLVTSEQAISRFAARLADLDDEQRGPKLTNKPKPRTSKTRERQIADAERELADAGIR